VPQQKSVAVAEEEMTQAQVAVSAVLVVEEMVPSRIDLME
jgi:hypothetical protein